MSSISDYIEAKKSEGLVPKEDETYKKCVSIRLCPVSLKKTEEMAKAMGMSRAGLVEKIATLAIEDAYALFSEK